MAPPSAVLKPFFKKDALKINLSLPVVIIGSPVLEFYEDLWPFLLGWVKISLFLKIFWHLH